MAEVTTSIRLSFGTELSVDGADLDGTPKSAGVLVEIPSILTFKNYTDQEVFVADNTGSTKGYTMISGECIIVDCAANRANHATFLGFAKGTEFFVTGSAGTGSFRIGVLTAQ